MTLIRSVGTETAAATPVPESHEIGSAASALGERTLMVMLRLAEDSTTGSAMPLLGTVADARAAAVAARAICSTAALICSPALAEEGEPSEAAISPRSEERPLVTAWAATVSSCCTVASTATSSVAAVAVAAIGVAVLLKESRVRADPAAPRPAFLGGVRDAVGDPVVSRVLLVTLIYMGGFSGWESTFGFWTEARYGWTAREVGLCFVVVGIVSVACQGFLAGRLARRFGESRVLAFGCLTFGTSLIAQVFASRLWPDADWMVPAIMAVGASGMAMTMPNLSALISRSVDPDRQGAMLGLNMASSSIARIFGPIIAGAIFSQIGHDWPLIIGAAMTIPAAVMAINAGRAFRKRLAAAVPAAGQ